mmetsp:Transcript_13242/g.23783  ORF Transcript_13242/g.23783 Transcript_13242/m.23783 type:complete len:155 (+) Transcript_13242:164-628(+)
MIVLPEALLSSESGPMCIETQLVSESTWRKYQALLHAQRLRHLQNNGPPQAQIDSSCVPFVRQSSFVSEEPLKKVPALVPLVECSSHSRTKASGLKDKQKLAVVKVALKRASRNGSHSHTLARLPHIIERCVLASKTENQQNEPYSTDVSSQID